MYLFYNLFAALHVSNDCFARHQEFINLLYLQLCTNHANVSNCLVLRLFQQLDTFGKIAMPSDGHIFYHPLSNVATQGIPCII